MVQHFDQVRAWYFPEAKRFGEEYWVQIDGADPTPVDLAGCWKDSRGRSRNLFDLLCMRHGGNPVAAIAAFNARLGFPVDHDLFPPTGIEDRALPDGFESVDQLLARVERDDASAFLGVERRFLCQGGSLVLAGPSGIGKSSLAMHLACHLAAGLPWFGMSVRRPLNVGIIQRENDDGDLAEMVADLRRQDPIAAHWENIRRRMHFCPTPFTGENFASLLGEDIRQGGLEVVIIDPLLAFAGGDISSQEIMTQFLRHHLQPVLRTTGCMAIIVHHTGKIENGGRSSGSKVVDRYGVMGSSEITNWCRAMITLHPAGRDEVTFKLQVSKRTKRSGIKSTFTGQEDVVFLQHALSGIDWIEVKEPREKKEPKKNSLSLVENSGLLAALREAGEVELSEFEKIYAAEMGVSSRTVRNHLNAFVEGGTISVREEPRPGGGKPRKFIRVEE